jgi:RHS repeat-associated protein
MILLDKMLSPFEKTAHADPNGSAAFAHHVHLTWTLPQYPSYGTQFTAYGVGGVIAPYTYSPIWKAPPVAQLSTVDVFSAMSTTDRKLVREYRLSYLYNNTQTRSYLQSIQMFGDCELSNPAGIPEATFNSTQAGQCEPAPTTTYSYYGVSPLTSGSPAPAPKVLATTPAYQPNMAADFLMDYNGDGVADLVSGLNGASQLDCYESQCTQNGTAETVNVLTGGLYGAFGGQLYNCPCGQGTGTIQGPDQYGAFTTPTTPGGPPGRSYNGPGTFTTSVANGLTTIQADDSMWSFSVFADWYSTGRTSFLQTLPQYMFSQTGFTNPQTYALFLGQFGDPASDGKVPLKSFELDPPDYQSLGYAMGYSTAGGPPTKANPTNPKCADPTCAFLYPGSFMPTRAFDVDGDGLPDMTFLPITDLHGSQCSDPDTCTVNGSISDFTPAFATYYTRRDRNGRTHPYSFSQAAYGTITCASPYMDPSVSSVVQTSASNGFRAMADIDGDGLLDEVLINKYDRAWDRNPSGPSNFVGLQVLPGRGDSTFGVPGGECSVGMTDINDGYGMGAFIGSSYAPQSDAVGGDSAQNSVIRFGDLNGDGMSDYAVLDSAGLHVCLRYGAWWDTGHYRCTTVPHLAPYNPSAPLISPTILIGDIDASGIQQVVYFPASKTPYGPPNGPATAVLVSPNGSSGTGPRDGLLQSVSNGLGAQTSFSYDTVHHRGQGPLPVPRWVVTAATTTNGLSGGQGTWIWHQYAYGTPIYDPRDMLFVGFSSVTDRVNGDLASRNSLGTVTKTTFATQTCATDSVGVCEGTALNSYGPLDLFSRGVPALVEVSENSAAGTKISATAYEYLLQTPYVGLDGRAGISVQSRTVHTYLWGDSQASAPGSFNPTLNLAGKNFGGPSLNGVSLPSPAIELRTMQLFDGNGNVYRDTNFGQYGVDPPIVRALTWGLSKDDRSGWNYRVTQDQTGYATDSTGVTIDGSQPYREYDYIYDAQGRMREEWTPFSGGQQLPGPSGGPRAAGQPVTALLQSNHLTLRIVNYDPTYGNVIGIGNQDNKCLLSFGYDPVFTQLPTNVTLFPDGCGGDSLTTTVTYDRRIDKITSSTDPAGRTTITDYDDFGRIIGVHKPSVLMLGATTTVFMAQYHDTNPIRRIDTQTGYGPDTGAPAAATFVHHYQYVDSLGQTLASMDEVDPATHQGNSWVVSGLRTTYSDGRTQSVALPIFATSPAAPGTLPSTLIGTPVTASFHYDALGRTVWQQDFRGHVSTNTFHNALFSVEIRDPEQLNGGHPKSLTTVTSNGLGQVVNTDAHSNVGPQGLPGDVITNTAYFASGLPKTISQSSPSGTVVRSLTYDSLGHLVQNKEPNVGTWNYAYDAEGRLVGTSDARGCGKNIVYDLGGRVLAADYSPCDTMHQPAYTSPTITPGLFPYPGAEESYAYDALGQLAAVADRGRMDAYQYDNAGRIQKVDRQLALPPAGGQVIPSTPLAYGAKHSFAVSQYSVTGQVLGWRLPSSSLGTPAGSAVSESTTYSYDGRVSQITASPSGTILQNATLNADGTPQTLTFGDAASTTAGYAYDNNGGPLGYWLNRSDGPWVSSYAPGSNAPSTAGDPALIGDLTDLLIGTDAVENPTSVTDTSSAAWPSGIQPVRQTYKYWDDYRLRSATTTTPPDGFLNPYEPEQMSGSPLYPQPANPSTDAAVGLQSYQYDWRGNATQSTDDAHDFYDRSLGNVTPVSGADQFSKATSLDGASQVSPAYDAAGNMTGFTVEINGGTPSQYTFTWDELGQLSSATRSDALGTVAETYSYSSDGQRVTTGKNVGGQVSYTVQVFPCQVLKDTSLLPDRSDYVFDASVEQVYFGGGLARLFSDSSGQMPQVTGRKYNTPNIHTFLVLSDPRGSSAFVIDDDTGELVEKTTYMAYGAIAADYRSQRWNYSREDNKFIGQRDNAEVGLAYFGARYYSPQLGRFISPDPLAIHGLMGDANPYEYAYGSPHRYVDPTGLDPDDPGEPEVSYSKDRTTWIDTTPTSITIVTRTRTGSNDSDDDPPNVDDKIRSSPQEPIRVSSANAKAGASRDWGAPYAPPPVTGVRVAGTFANLNDIRLPTAPPESSQDKDALTHVELRASWFGIRNRMNIVIRPGTMQTTYFNGTDRRTSNGLNGNLGAHEDAHKTFARLFWTTDNVQAILRGFWVDLDNVSDPRAEFGAVWSYLNALEHALQLRAVDRQDATPLPLFPGNH